MTSVHSFGDEDGGPLTRDEFRAMLMHGHNNVPRLCTKDAMLAVLIGTHFAHRRSVYEVELLRAELATLKAPAPAEIAPQEAQPVAVAAPSRKFKVGDRVRVFGNIDKEAIIDRHVRDGCYRLRYDDGTSSMAVWGDHELTLIEPAPAELPFAVKLTVNDCTVSMKVVRQPEETRGVGDICELGGLVLKSLFLPAFRLSRVFLRGINHEHDDRIAYYKCATPQEASVYRDRVQALIDHANATWKGGAS